MCGIAGYLGAFDSALLSQMGKAQGHRGPDGADSWSGERVGLSHVRLAILDLSETGRQPMRSADGRVIVTFNGEIYNYRELRRRLEREGEAFRGGSDIGPRQPPRPAWREMPALAQRHLRLRRLVSGGAADAARP
jgi:asparagine synthase (glutamine-hydrolysing)